MTVETATSRVVYVGAGTTGPFTIPFYFLANADIRAIKVTIADGTEDELSLTTDFTLTGAGNENGGALTLVSSLSSLFRLVIFRDPGLLQLADYPRNDAFPSETHEQALDLAMMIDQRSRELVARSLRQPDGDASNITPFPAAVSRASKFLSFDASGNPQASTGIGTDAALRVDLATGGETTGAALVAFLQAGIGATSRTLQNRARDTLNVKDFGAVGDGVADDTLAIQAAINAAELASANVFFPNGAYGTTAQLLLDAGRAGLIGESMQTAEIKRLSGTFGALIQVGATTGNTQINYVEIAHLTLDGSAGCTDAVLKIRNVGSSYFHDLTIEDGDFAGLRTDTSTDLASSNQHQNIFLNIISQNNDTHGFLFQGEKYSRFDHLFAWLNGGVGIEFKAWKYDAGTSAESTECSIGHMTSAGNTGDGFVFDQVEKYTIGTAGSFINGGYGMRFKSTLQAASGNGTNNVNCGVFTSRNDALGGFVALSADDAFLSGATFHSIYIIGNVGTDVRGMHLQGVTNSTFGNVRIAAAQGEGLRIEAGTPLNVAAESANLNFGNVAIYGCGNASAVSNHGITFQNSSSDIQIGTLYLSNAQTTGTNFEFSAANTSGPIMVGTAIMKPATAANHIANTTASFHFGLLRLNSLAPVLAVKDGISSPAAINQLAQIFIDAADGDLKIRFSDGVVKTIVTDV